MLNPNFDYDNQREITFPETLNESLNAYYSAPQELQIILDSAISYSVSAMELRFQKEH